MANDTCRSCGACCAFLRVGFPEWETTRGGGAVPADLTDPWVPKHRRMRGTAASPPRCAALDGEIGKHTTCTIHGKHPSPCRELEPSTPERPNPFCDEARIAHGLAPLSAGAPAAPAAAAPASGKSRKKGQPAAQPEAAAQPAAQPAPEPAAAPAPPVAEPAAKPAAAPAPPAEPPAEG
jgi:Fe-S-cluster containining protein